MLTPADDAKRVDVEAGVRLVQHRELGVQDAHLDHLVALLLAARKADIDGALEHLRVHLQRAGLRAGEFQELGARQRGLAACAALAVEAFAQELDVGDAGDLDRILEAEEQARRGARVRIEVEQVDAVEGDAALGHIVAGAAAEDIAERRFARAVRTHDRVHLTRVHGQAEALEDRLAVDFGVEVIDLKH